MKTKFARISLACLLVSMLGAQLPTAFGQGTAFVYQGQLQNNGTSASGTYNFTFALFSTNTNGVAVAGPLTNNGVIVSNGLFTALIDFGPGAFTGATNWLEIAVETNGSNAFTTLSPRQQLTPMPYAIYAESAGDLTGTLPAAQLTSIGNTNGGEGNFFVGQAGNSTMSGSYNAANGIAALADNSSGSYNTAIAPYALSKNTSGSRNIAIGYGALYANINGSDNTAIGYDALVGNTGGSNNIALGYQAGYDITTGSSNIDIGNLGLATDTNLIRIGTAQTATYVAGVINGNGAGLTNLSASAAQLTSIGNANGGYGNFFVGPSGNSTMTGSYNTANGLDALFSNRNGSYNTANGFAALESDTSGSDNTADGEAAMSYNSTGSDNTAVGNAALYSNMSGSNNIALGYQAGYNLTTGNSNIDIGNTGLSTDTNLIRIGTGQTQAFIAGVISGNGGGLTNLSAAQLISIGNTNISPKEGVGSNFFVGPCGNSVMIGNGNTAIGVSALSANGDAADNTAVGLVALAANTSGAGDTAIGAMALFVNTSGQANTASGFGSLEGNTTGSQNTANGSQALAQNTTGSGNIALGYLAGLNITTGSSNIDVGNQGLATDTNITRIGTSQTACYLAGTVYANGTFVSSSDRSAKENFRPVDPRQVLAQVAALPVTRWNYKQDATAEHIGPMAQDFYSAFSVGTDDKHIAVIDEGGVALAAIQGLNQKLDEKDAEIQDLKQSVAELKAQVEKLTNK